MVKRDCESGKVGSTEAWIARLRGAAPPDECPSESELLAYALGLVDDERIEAHLGCRRCRQVVGPIVDELDRALHTRAGVTEVSRLGRNLKVRAALVGDADTGFLRGERGASALPPESVSATRCVIREFIAADLEESVVRPLRELGWAGVVVRMTDATDQPSRVIVASGRAGRFSNGGYHFPLSLVRSREDCSVVSEPCRWTRRGRHLEPVAPLGCHLQTLGSVELSRSGPVSSAMFDRTTTLLTQVAAAAHDASLLGMCEKLLTILVRATKAAHGALHVGSEPHALYRGKDSLVLRYGQGASFGGCRPGDVGAAPRCEVDAIGYQAVSHQRPVQVAGDDLKRRSPALYEQGIHCATAIPIIATSGQCLGLLYLHDSPLAASAQTRRLVRAVGEALGVALRARRFHCESGDGPQRAVLSEAARGPAVAHLGIVGPKADRSCTTRVRALAGSKGRAGARSGGANPHLAHVVHEVRSNESNLAPPKSFAESPHRELRNGPNAVHLVADGGAPLPASRHVVRRRSRVPSGTATVAVANGR
jgi:GAF domain